MALIKYNKGQGPVGPTGLDTTNVSVKLLRHVYARLSETYNTLLVLQSLSAKPHLFDARIKLLQEDMTIVTNRIFDLSPMEELLQDFTSNSG